MFDFVTDSYIKENKYVLSLPRFSIKGTLQQFKPDSVRFVTLRKTIALRAVLGFIKELLLNGKWLAKIRSLKSSAISKKALVIGNGPSQGFLYEDMLTDFKINGGEIFVVNFWCANANLSKVIPTYLVISDPETLNSSCAAYLRDKNQHLLDYLKTNNSIQVLCPLNRCSELGLKLGNDRIIGFVDHELRIWSCNLSPLYPRGYLSMTLFKALAMALWLDYEKIYLIGMDNTYPRNIYCDSDNKILNLEAHSGIDSSVCDQSSAYECMGDLLVELSHIFYDARKFSNCRILNLDPYSLTDAFAKTDLPVDKLREALNIL